jgi:phosphate transport system permease protein
MRTMGNLALNRRQIDTLMRHFLHLVAPTCILVVFLILFFIAKEALPFALKHSLVDIFNPRWTPVSFQHEQLGIVALLNGSLLVSAIATVISVPTGILMAVYIAEMTTERENLFLKTFVEFLASIPSVVIGFFGLVVLAPIIKHALGLDSVLNAMTAGLLLGIMALPTIVSLSEDALKNVPENFRQGSLALGATPLETTFRVMLPAAAPGITAACLLGMGRVIGETMVALMLTGNATQLTLNATESVRTLTATIAAEMGEVAFGSDHYQALFFVGFVLLLITLGINLLAQRGLKRSAQ